MACQNCDCVKVVSPPLGITAPVCAREFFVALKNDFKDVDERLKMIDFQTLDTQQVNFLAYTVANENPSFLIVL